MAAAIFTNPIMLAALGGAAVPLALHLLSRAQYRRVRWGAMMFLETEGSNELRSARMKRWTLLGLRMAAIALLAVALAGPMIEPENLVDPQTSSALAVIVVDCSASMGYDERGRTRMDLARGTVLQILSRLGRGDRAVLVPTSPGLSTAGAAGSPSQRAHQPMLPASSDLEAVATRVANLEAAAEGSANIAEAITTALNVLDQESRGSPAIQRHLYVVCDRQAASWANVTDSFISAWRDRISKTTQLSRFVVVPVGAEGSANVGVESIEMETLPVIRGIPNRVKVTLRNYGEQPRAGVGVIITADKRELRSTTINLPARSTGMVETAVTFPQTGSPILSATISARGLGGDDRLSAVISAVDPIRTLLVINHPDGASAEDDAAQLVRAALAPYRTTRRRGGDPASVDVIAASEMAGTELADYQVIALSDVERLPGTSVVRALEQFVSSGGGLLVAAGARTDPNEHNNSFFRDGAGLLPASLGTPEDEVLDASLQIDDVAHPALSFLRASPEMVPVGVVKRWIRASPAPGARVLARVASGGPLLVERGFGRGRVILLTTSLGSGWGTLPKTGCYVPLLQSLVRHLAAGGLDRRNLRIGEEIEARLDQPAQGQVTITLPDGSAAGVDVVNLNGLPQARFTATQQVGTYFLRARVGTEVRVIPFIVRSGMEESDLTPLSGERWNRLSGELGFTLVHRAEDAVVRTAATEPLTLWLPLVLGVVGVLIVESGLSRWWSS